MQLDWIEEIKANQHLGDEGYRDESRLKVMFDKIWKKDTDKVNYLLTAILKDNLLRREILGILELLKKNNSITSIEE